MPDFPFITLEYTNPVANHLILKLKYPLNQYKLVNKEKTSERLMESGKITGTVQYKINSVYLHYSTEYRYCFLG